ncbi:GTPase [Bacteriovorax sp. PP10]|uniref:GTPase Der n=1 Tax=Bacteriovorax antarcticus TaxID=3088717 RepID=A0ABU5VTQ1_9BACT|nr:GTPase [Bacteriovorax sp. PP10]MEA9356436.1 GTPase [Bacteriovorax sp. PP10]
MSSQQYHRTMVVSLIGRPNVGKSSIFNRLMRKAHKAITHDKPGVTRDRHYGIATFEELAHTRSVETILVDTGGFYPTKIEENVPKKYDQVMNKFFNIMTEQARIAIKESDLILFVVDSREGVLPFDQAIADYIRTQRKEFWVLVNKYDTDKQEGEELEFYQLGIGEEQLFKISAEHGLGLLDLKQAIHKKVIAFEEKEKDEMSQLQKGVTPREKVAARLALIGAPNAGKSTMLNLLLGSERALVSDIAGTTVDPIEGFFDVFFGKEASLLEEDVIFAKTDNLLFQQYEEFRANNAEVYESLAKSYNLEEEGTKGTPIYDEENYLSDETPLYDETVEGDLDEEFEAEFDESEIDFDSALSDDEVKKTEDELYDTVFAVEDSTDFDLEDSEDVMTDGYSQELLAAEAQLAKEAKEEGSQWRSMHIVDTAGIRRQKAVEGFIEQQSVYRSLRCITESDIIIFMIDATVGISHQDRRLLDIALDKGKSCIVCLNKVDLLKDKLVDEAAKKEWISDLRLTVPWLAHCDLIPVSAKYNKHIWRLKESIKKTVLIRNRNIGTGKLNRYVYQLVESNPALIKKAGKRLKVKYASMLKSSPPTFLFFTNLSKDIPDNYKNFLKNGLRKEFTLDNTPIHLIFRTGEDLQKRLGKRMKEVT